MAHAAFPTAPPPFARQKITADDVNPYILTPEERAGWKDRIASMRNEGLFTPPGMTETISLPGARGGSNWGSGAVNAAKGLLYLNTQDWPTIYKLSLEDPLGKRASDTSAIAVYEARCQLCHGVNGVRSGPGPPALAAIGQRLAFNAFFLTVHSGKGKMPAFPDLDDAAAKHLYEYLGTLKPASKTEEASAIKPATRGPVVASGGAPGGLEARPESPNQYTPLGGPPYPPNSHAPRDRYYTNWGLYPDQPYVIGPPWSSVVAYDLNAGTIKWKVPLGQDAEAAAQGAQGTGAFMAEHHGLIVTSAGLIFIAASDGKVRALDEDTGKVVWSATLPAAAEGIPAMYEAGGRQYLVVSASSPINSGGGHAGSRGASGTATAELPKGYVAFALPLEVRAALPLRSKPTAR